MCLTYIFFFLEVEIVLILPTIHAYIFFFLLDFKLPHRRWFITVQIRFTRIPLFSVSAFITHTNSKVIHTSWLPILRFQGLLGLDCYSVRVREWATLQRPHTLRQNKQRPHTQVHVHTHTHTHTHTHFPYRYRNFTALKSPLANLVFVSPSHGCGTSREFWDIVGWVIRSACSVKRQRLPTGPCGGVPVIQLLQWTERFRQQAFTYGQHDPTFTSQLSTAGTEGLRSDQ